MRIKSYFLASILGISMLVGSCTSDTPKEPVTPENPETPALTDIPELPDDWDKDATPYQQFTPSNENREVMFALNSFAWKFLKEMGSKTNDNVVVSPLSISMLLSIAANGADQETLDEILSALHISDINNLNEFNSKFLNYIEKADNQVSLKMANSLWVHNSFPIYKDFADFVKTTYLAEVRNLDMTDTNSIDIINNWVKDNTSGLIPSFLDKTALNTPFTMINTSFFRGGWTDPFDESLTTEDDFKNASGTVSKVKTMHADYTFMDFMITYQYTRISKSYGNSTFTASIYLPNEGMDVKDVLDRNSGPYADGSVKVKLSLPKFTLRFREEQMQEYLKTMGINSLFSSNHALSRLTNGSPAYINKVIQETVLSIDEKGAEAAASTGAICPTSPGILPPPELPKEFDFKVDRPFIFIINEETTNCILYAAIIRNL